MPGGKLPGSISQGLEDTCTDAAEKLSKIAPGEKNEKKLAKLMTEHVCKNVDDKILTAIAEQLAKAGEDASAKPAKGTLPKITGIPTLKAPGSDSTSFTIPLKGFDIGGNKANLELKVWGDPKDFQNNEKGAEIFFTVKF
jgi:hypothetical protein